MKQFNSINVYVRSQIKTHKKGIALLITTILSLWLFFSFGDAAAWITNTNLKEKQTKLDSTFSYQGQLNQEGAPANGIYDFVFRLYTSGSGTNQVGEDFSVSNITVSDGLFTVQLDFGSDVFNGDARWLEISVAAAGENPAPLTPLQPLTAVPYALYGEDDDADPTNELQSFIVSGNKVSLSHGGGSFDLIKGDKGDKGETGEAGPPIDFNIEAGQTHILPQTIITGIEKVFTIPVSFDNAFSAIPIITISPITEHPNNVSISLDKITTEGFTLYGSISEPAAAIITLDNNGFVGHSTSMKVINGKPAISYSDTTNTSLKFIYALNEDGTEWSNPITVDNDIGTNRLHTSLASINGKPAISYLDSTTNKLKYVQAKDVYGTTWGSPIELDNIGPIGHIMSLVNVNNKPGISYFDSTNYDLKFIRASDSDGLTWDPPMIVDGNGLVGTYSSLAMVNGNPAISYYHQGNRDLKYVRATDSNGTSWGTPQTVDSEGLVGQFTSLVVINGYPAISYAGLLNSTTHGDLKYIRATDANGSSWGTSVILHEGQQTGAHSSLAVINGKPAISYFESENDDLRFIQASDPNGDSWESSILLESDGSVGGYNSLIEVNGKPAISYLKNNSGSDGHLKYIMIPDSIFQFSVNWMAIQP